MYYIVVYDIASPKRLPRLLKICRQYLNWIQCSVFEGELSKAQFSELYNRLKKNINKEEDSVILFAIRTPKVVDRTVLGKEKNEITNFI